MLILFTIFTINNFAHLFQSLIGNDAVLRDNQMENKKKYTSARNRTGVLFLRKWYANRWRHRGISRLVLVLRGHSHAKTFRIYVCES